MNRTFKRSLALLMVLVMCLSFLPILQIKTGAANVNYVYSGNYIYNWGTRGTVATFLSPNAETFYAQNKTYDELMAYSGGSYLNTTSAATSALYSELKKIMTNNHDHQTSYAETKELYRYTDCQNNGGAISSFYSGTSIGPSWDGSWNREHTWPDSKGLGGNDENDIMMLRPTSTSENSSRGNTAYGKSSSYYNPNSESGGKYDLRGDVARIFLYVYVRWGNTSYAWGTGGVMESVTVLLEWMEADPVDTWELGRNDSVESITGTRNVFVDYPELAFALFGAEIPDNMQTPSGEASADCGHNNYNTGVVTAPTCTTNGYTLVTCQTAGCGSTRKISIVAATGHSFTAGVCTVCGAAEPTAPKEPTYATTVAAGTPYKLGFYSTADNTAYYFIGSMSGYYGATDTAYEKGVNVYVESVTGGYRLYFMNSNNQKQYINLVQNETYYNFTYSTTATSTFTWDSAKCSFHTTVGDQTGYMGTYGTYKTVGVLTSAKLQSTDYFAHLYTDGTSAPDSQPCEHNYQNNVCVNCGDVKACEHNYQNNVCVNCGDVRACEHTYQNNVCIICGHTKPTSAGKVSISFATSDSRVELSTSTQVWKQDGLTVTNNKIGTSADVANYVAPCRFYQGSEVIIAYPNMTKIEIDCSGLESKHIEPWKTVPAGATVTVSGNIVTITFTSPVDSLVYSSLTKQARANKITVYAEVTACTHTNTTIDGELKATCTNEGFTGNTICADCRELLSAGTTTPTTDHDYGEWAEVLAPTCDTPGEERKSCNNCDYYESNAIAALGHKDENGDGACDVCGKQEGNTGNTEDGKNTDAGDDENVDDNISTITSSCGNVIYGSSFAIMMIIGTAAAMLAKKKKD